MAGVYIKHKLSESGLLFLVHSRALSSCDVKFYFGNIVMWFGIVHPLQNQNVQSSLRGDTARLYDQKKSFLVDHVDFELVVVLNTSACLFSDFNRHL